MEITSLQIGSRIFCDGEYGTVLYQGTIENFDGTWLGIEWDNPSRGKHSGSHNNITYFQTSVPNSGSFIRIQKANAGISCYKAILEKYGCTGMYANTVSIVSLPQETGRERHIEMVGMEKIIRKQSNFSNLTEIALSSMLVNGTVEGKEFKELIPNVNNLDLSRNLLSSWEEVAKITQQLAYLKTLILSKNRLKIPTDLENYQQCFAVLKMIVLNDMSYSWNELLLCATMWPYIEELLALDNGITFLEEPLYPMFCKLRLLNLDNNPIRNWSEICKLGRLTNLEELHIDNIALESISFSDVPPTEKTDLFQNLNCLYIRHNKLSQWKDISELNKLVKLKVLTLTNNPILLTVNLDTARQLVISKISGLEKLNKIEIGRSERRGAEFDYIKLYHCEWLANGGQIDTSLSNPSENFLSIHPTYPLLVQKHGVAEESEVKPQSSLLKNNLIFIEIYSPLLPDKQPVKKKLPAEMTVGKLKALAQRIFKIGAQNIILTCLNKENESQKTKMDNDLRLLSFYSLTDKEKISVEW